jgi:hypothetical protein
MPMPQSLTDEAIKTAAYPTNEPAMQIPLECALRKPVGADPCSIAPRKRSALRRCGVNRPPYKQKGL